MYESRVRDTLTSPTFSLPEYLNNYVADFIGPRHQPLATDFFIMYDTAQEAYVEHGKLRG